MKNITSYGDFYSMKKSDIARYLSLKGFGCLASLKQSKSDLIFHAITIFKKCGGLIFE